MKSSSKFVIVLAIILVGLGVSFFLYHRSYQISKDYRARTSHVLFRVNGDGYFVRIDDDRRKITVIAFPKESFDPVRRESLYSERPLTDLEKIENLLDVKAEMVYYSVLSKDEFGELSRATLGERYDDFERFLKDLSKRGKRFFDVFSVVSWSRKLGFSNMNRYALYKFLEKMGTYAVNFYRAPSLTEKPLVIEARGRQFVRIYLDVEKMRLISEEIKR